VIVETAFKAAEYYVVPVRRKLCMEFAICGYYMDMAIITDCKTALTTLIQSSLPPGSRLASIDYYYDGSNTQTQCGHVCSGKDFWVVVLDPSVWEAPP
jgi:hypothetical protein